MAILSEMGEVTEGMMDTKVNAIEDLHLQTIAMTGAPPKSHTAQRSSFYDVAPFLSHTNIKIPSLSNR